jgi:hypothetical protein
MILQKVGVEEEKSEKFEKSGGPKEKNLKAGKSPKREESATRLSAVPAVLNYVRQGQNPWRSARRCLRGCIRSDNRENPRRGARRSLRCCITSVIERIRDGVLGGVCNAVLRRTIGRRGDGSDQRRW